MDVYVAVGLGLELELVVGGWRQHRAGRSLLVLQLGRQDLHDVGVEGGAQHGDLIGNNQIIEKSISFTVTPLGIWKGVTVSNRQLTVSLSPIMFTVGKVNWEGGN